MEVEVHREEPVNKSKLTCKANKKKNYEPLPVAEA